MADVETAAFHDDSFRLYLHAWRDATYRVELEMGLGEAAYHVLAHAGMLQRMPHTQKRVVTDELFAMSQDDRVRLVRDACEFAIGFAVPGHFDRLLAEEILDTDELAEIEGALIQRDELDAVLRMMDQLVGDCLEHNDDLLASVARAHCAAAEFDDRLAQRPDILAVASRIVADSTEPAHFAPWLSEARKLDRNLFEPAPKQRLSAAVEVAR